MDDLLTPRDFIERAKTLGPINKPLDLLLNKFNYMFVEENIRKVLKYEEIYNNGFSEKMKYKIREYSRSFLIDLIPTILMSYAFYKALQAASFFVLRIMFVPMTALYFYILVRIDIERHDDMRYNMRFLGNIPGNFRFIETKDYELIKIARDITNSCLSDNDIEDHLRYDYIKYFVMLKGKVPVSYLRMVLFDAIVYNRISKVAYIDTIEVPNRKLERYRPLIITMAYLAGIYAIKNFGVNYVVINHIRDIYVKNMMRKKALRYKPISLIEKGIMNGSKIRPYKARRDYLVLAGDRSIFQ